MDIWIYPGTPKCDQVAHLIGRDSRVRLIDAKQYADYVPSELNTVPGFVFTASDGKRYPWQGDQCLQYVKLYFGKTIQDIRDRPQQPYYPPGGQPGGNPGQYSYQQPAYTEPYHVPQTGYPQQPQRPQPGYGPAPHHGQSHPQAPVPRRQHPQQGGPQMGFGQHTFSNLMQGRVTKNGVMTIDDSKFALSGQGPSSAQAIAEERARQDRMYMQR